MKNFLLIVTGLVVGGIVFFLLYSIYFQNSTFLSPVASDGEEGSEKPLDKYTFERLSQRIFEPRSIELGEKIAEEDDYSSYVFFFDPQTATKEATRASGLVNIPNTAGSYPVIVMLRGYVPIEIYTPGEGSRRTGEYLASHGFITVAPDFLGYGESDNPSMEPLEERFQRYETVLGLLSSIQRLNDALSSSDEVVAQYDGNNIGIWGHSNGGHIALSVLSITGEEHPTVLWNPVSKPFPYSILYYTDEYDDEGKALRKLVSDFESEYDVLQYSPSRYYEAIEAPLSLHQGLDDVEVPRWWSDELVQKLEDFDVDVEYYTYPNSDHNMLPDGWGAAVVRTAQFFDLQFSDVE